MTLGVEFRAFNFPDDLPLLVSLKNDYFQAHQIERVTDENKQRQLLSYPNHQPEKDNYVAIIREPDLQVIGHIWTWQQTTTRSLLDLHVHPQWERREIGSRLVQWAIERAVSQNSKQLDTQIDINCLPELKFFKKHGFQPLGTYLHMHHRPNFPLPSFSMIDGYTIRTYADVRDLHLYTQAMNLSYGDLWGHMADVPETHVAKSLDFYSPDEIFLLFDAENTIAGMGRIHVDTNLKNCLIDVPGIVPKHRHSALYRAMLLYSLHAIYELTENPLITMDSWGDFDSTVNTFWELGFTVKQHSLGYSYYL